MTPRSLAGLLRHLSTGVLDQVMLSGASFVAGFLMIRYTSDADYGRFVLAQSAVLLLLSVQASWVLAPLATVAPTKSSEIKRTMIGAIRISHGRFIRRIVFAALLIPPTGYLLHAWNGTIALAAEATILTGWAATQREYMRTVLLVYSRPHIMLHADLFYVAALLVGIPIAAFAGLPDPGLWAIVTLALAGWAGATAGDRALGRYPGWECGDAKPFWREFRHLGLWSTVGSVIYWLFAQSYNYVLATRLDLTAVANVNAARLVLMPVFVFTLDRKSTRLNSSH